MRIGSAKIKGDSLRKPGNLDRLAKGVIKSNSTKDQNGGKQVNFEMERGSGKQTSKTITLTSGSKRHASAGAGANEPTVTTVRRRAKRATGVEAGSEIKISSHSPTRRNDLKSTFNPKPMKGSKSKSKPVT